MFARHGIRIGDVLGLAPQCGLVEIASRRTQVSAALKANRAQRTALLLSDATDRQIATSDAEGDRLHLQLERLDAAEVQLRTRAVQSFHLSSFQARPR